MIITSLPVLALLAGCCKGNEPMVKLPREQVLLLPDTLAADSANARMVYVPFLPDWVKEISAKAECKERFDRCAPECNTKFTCADVRMHYTCWMTCQRNFILKRITEAEYYACLKACNNQYQPLEELFCMAECCDTYSLCMDKAERISDGPPAWWWDMVGRWQP